MPHLFTAVQLLHIGAGSIALVVAPGAMVARKGGRWHRRWGRIYFWSMAVVALTAVVLAVLRSGPFLFLVALFSFYLAFSGYRVLARKSPAQRATWPDWSMVLVLLAGGVGLLAHGARTLGQVETGTVSIVFGVIALLLARSEIEGFRRPSTDPRAWWFTHMRRMLGAYIATVSAFSVVNFTVLPPVARWLWATAVGTVGIALWTRHYRAQFQRTGGTPAASSSE